MLQFFDTVSDTSGNALPGATVQVLNWPALTNANIFSTNGTASPIPLNTMTADATGQVSCYLPDGAYQLVYVYNGTTFKTRAPVQMLDPMSFVAAADTGAADAYVITDSRYPAALYAGLKIEFRAVNANTGAAGTLNLNSTGAQPLVASGGSALAAGLIPANGIVRLEWNANTSKWEVVSAQSQPFYAIIAAEGSVTVTNTSFNYGDLRRYGGDPTGVANSTVAYQAACTVGLSVYISVGTYTLNDMITMTTPLQRVYGEGLQSVVSVLSSMNLARNGVFNFTAGGNDSGPQFENFRIICDQSGVATVGTRVNLVQYPAAFFMRNSPRTRFYKLRVEQFLIGIDAQGLSAGCCVENVEMGCYLYGMVINGSGDTTRLLDFRYIPFNGWTSNQRNIFSDGGNTHIMTGRCDGLNMSNCIATSAGLGTIVAINSFLGTGVNAAGTVAGAGFLTGFTTGEIVNHAFDSNSKLIQNAVGSWLVVSNSFWSLLTSVAAWNAIALTAGTLEIGNCHMECVGIPTVPCITISNASGSAIKCFIDNMDWVLPSPAGTGYTALSSTGAQQINLSIRGNQFNVANTSGNSVPIIQITGAGTTLMFENNRWTPTNIGGTTQVALSLDTDGQHLIANNEFDGWLIGVPTVGAFTTWTSAIISHNGKRGAINNNNANICALQGNAGTGTVAAASTVYLGPGGYANAAVSVNTFLIPRAGLIVGFQVKIDNAPVGVQTDTYTVFQNGGATAMTGVITGAATTLSVITNAFTAALGDRIELQLVTSGTAVAAHHSFALLFEPA